MRVYDKRIVLQKMDEETELWEDALTMHASINKAQNDSEISSSGTTKISRALSFEVRHFKGLEQIADNTELYRIIYNGSRYNITDYDDYMLQHKTVRMRGVLY